MSNLKPKAEITTYEQAKAFLGDRFARQLCYATTVHRVAVDQIAIRHHHTDVVTYWADGTITLDNGGWVTATTTHRMHRFTPEEVRVWRFKGHNFVSVDGGRGFMLTGPVPVKPGHPGRFHHPEPADRTDFSGYGR
jgi:hypothetical protein